MPCTRSATRSSTSSSPSPDSSSEPDMSVSTPAQGARQRASASPISRFPALGPEQYSTRLIAYCALGVAAVAAGARIPGAIRDSFWEDEVASAHVLIQSTPWGMLHQVARTEATPPLWYALGWLLHQIGLSPAGYRWASVLAGALLAAGTVLLALRVVPLWASAVAGILVALGWQFVMHGRELRACEGNAPRGRRRYVLPAVVALAALTNYFFLLSVAAALAWLGVDPRLRPVRRRVARQIAR